MIDEQKIDKQRNGEVEAHLVALELQLQSAPVRGNAAAAGDLLAEDFREFGASGRVWDKAALLAELAAEPPHAITSDTFQCQWLSGELALLTYVSRSPARAARRSSIWRRESGRWRLVFHQGTVIPAAAV